MWINLESRPSDIQILQAILAEIDGWFDHKILPRFDRSGAMVEWLKKLKLVCDLSEVKQLDHVIPLCLTERAFVVYQQLTKDVKSDVLWIKEALIIAFVTDRFMAYEQFEVHVLHPEKTVDMYLADLWKLLVLFRGMPESVIA